MYADSTLTAVSYRELINRLGKPLNVEDLQLSEKTLSGIIFLPADVFQFFCLYLITSLNGSLILSGQSFLKKQDLGKKVFTSHLSIYDSPQSIMDTLMRRYVMLFLLPSLGVRLETLFTMLSK